MVIEAISGTWSVGVSAFYNKNPIYLSAGKGVTKEYALASAYAELYERFCNKSYLYGNFPVSIMVGQLSYQKNGYFFDEEEKVVTFSDGVKEHPFIYKTVKQIEETLSLSLHNQWVGVPFINLQDSQDRKYLDLRILSMLERSSGMAAGNTLQEAIIQGLSEHFEHQVRWNFLDLIKNQDLVLLNINTCLKHNLPLQEIINNIKSENDFYLFDGSYYYNTPVLFGVIINKKQKTITVNFSAFPVFDIAVERICTELYQGLNSYSEKRFTVYPSKEKEIESSDYFWNESEGSFFRTTSLPEELFYKAKNIKNNPNEKVFLLNVKEYTEEELYDYYLSLIDRNNYRFYYYDCSLSPNMYAIKLYRDNYLSMPCIYQTELPDNVLQGLLTFHYAFEDFIFNHELNLMAMNKLIALYDNYTPIELNLFKRYRSRLPFQVFSPWMPSDFYIILKEINGFFEWFLNKNLIDNTKDPLFADKYREYAIKLRYLTSPLYTKNESLQILNCLDIPATEEDLQFYNNKFYILDKVIYDNINDLFCGENFAKYINFLSSLKYSSI